MYKVAQCWDDGCHVDIDVVELCRKYGAKATFNLNGGHFLPNSRRLSGERNQTLVYNLSRAEVKSVYDGFEVASHTMNHIHPTQVELDVFRREALDGKHFLEDLFQQVCRGFAWPYGDRNPDCIKALRQAGFAYGRTTDVCEAEWSYTDPMELPVSCHLLIGGFEEKMAQAKAKNGVFYFWGHSYEFLDNPQYLKDYERNLRLIAEDPEAQWVDVIDLVGAE